MQAVAIVGDPGAMLALLALFQAGNMAGIMRIACNGVFRVSMAFFNVQCIGFMPLLQQRNLRACIASCAAAAMV